MNDCRKALEIEARGDRLLFPYAHLRVSRNGRTGVVEVYVDPELGSEAFTYVLDKGEENSAHVDELLAYRKSVGQLLALLHVLDCDVDLVVKERSRKTA